MVAWSMTGRESLLGVAAGWMRRRGERVAAFLAVALRFVLMAAGFAAVTIGAATLAHWAGWIVGGLSLLVLEAMVKRR